MATGWPRFLLLGALVVGLVAAPSAAGGGTTAAAIASTASVAAARGAIPGVKPPANSIALLRKVVQGLRQIGAGLWTGTNAASQAFKVGVAACDSAQQAQGEAAAALWKVVEQYGQGIVSSASGGLEILSQGFGQHTALLQRYLPPNGLPNNQLGSEIRAIGNEADTQGSLANKSWQTVTEDLRNGGQGLVQHVCHPLQPPDDDPGALATAAHHSTSAAVRDYSIELNLLAELNARHR